MVVILLHVGGYVLSRFVKIIEKSLIQISVKIPDFAYFCLNLLMVCFLLLFSVPANRSFSGGVVGFDRQCLVDA